MAEKTDLGRLAGPSILRLVDEAMNVTGSPSLLNGQISAEIWDNLERMLEVTIIVVSYSNSFGVLQHSGINVGGNYHSRFLE